MLPFQQRVIDEHKELSIKINSLIAFQGTPIFASITDEDCLLLLSQLKAMQSYQDILNKRIERFGVE